MVCEEYWVTVLYIYEVLYTVYENNLVVIEVPRGPNVWTSSVTAPRTRNLWYWLTTNTALFEKKKGLVRCEGGNSDKLGILSVSNAGPLYIKVNGTRSNLKKSNRHWDKFYPFITINLVYLCSLSQEYELNILFSTLVIDIAIFRFNPASQLYRQFQKMDCVLPGDGMLLIFW
jgi:hypothetical protein